jgi:hypothetical protein
MECRHALARPCGMERIWLHDNRSYGRVRITDLNILQDAEASGPQREGEAPAELWLVRLRRSVALPASERG